MFSDIDYSEYLSDTSPSAFDSSRKQIDEWFYRYMSILLSQPFDVAKTVLQVKSQDVDGGKVQPIEAIRRHQSYGEGRYADVGELLPNLNHQLTCSVSIR